MRQRTLYSLLVIISLVGVPVRVSAHLNGNHQLGMVDGFSHLFTEPDHVLLMVPALAALVYYGFRVTQRLLRKNT